MIYTVTFNPSLDYIVEVNDFTLGITNRTSSELMLPGGKGLNVSMVLGNLGVDSTAIYYSAGFIGEEITRLLREKGVKAEEIKVDNGCSRINVKLSSIEGTEINGMGPAISENGLKLLYERLDQLTSGDFLVLAGSIPSSMPESIYSDIMKRLQGKGVNFVVDATGTLLLNTLKYKPFLVKPNIFELGEMFGVSLDSFDTVEPYARKLQQLGAQNVIVSLAEQGAVMVTAEGSYLTMGAPKGQVINAVGAGDSLVAGFLAGYMEAVKDKGASVGKVMEQAFNMGVAAGSASAFSSYLATREEIEKLLHISD